MFGIVTGVLMVIECHCLEHHLFLLKHWAASISRRRVPVGEGGSRREAADVTYIAEDMVENLMILEDCSSSLDHEFYLHQSRVGHG